MKDLVRSKTSLSEEIENILNKQIANEAKASSNYLAMASWCESQGYAKSGEYLYAQSGEEREHMQKIFSYVNKVGGRAYAPEVIDIQQDFNSLKDVFESALEQEIQITQSIHSIVDKCHAVKDYSTIQFMDWFLKEQVEEEASARRVLEIFDLIDEEGAGLYNIDKAIGKLREQE